MKVTPIPSNKISFKGILCPNKYSESLKECIDEVIPPFKELIIVSETKSPVKKFLNKFFHMKPKVEVVPQKHPYHFGGYLFLKDPLQRMTPVEPGVFKCDYDVWCHSIYKNSDEKFHNVAEEEEKNVFELLKKKISETQYVKNNETITDEVLFKNHGIALLSDDKNILSALKIHKVLSNIIKNLY